MLTSLAISPRVSRWNDAKDHATAGLDSEAKAYTNLRGRSERWLAACGISTGLLTIFIQHTSASLTIQENADPDVQADLKDFFGQDCARGQPAIPAHGGRSG